MRLVNGVAAVLAIGLVLAACGRESAPAANASSSVSATVRGATPSVEPSPSTSPTPTAEASDGVASSGALTIPNEPTGPPIDGEPVTGEDSDDAFRLTVRADQDRYRAGQEIDVLATLTYVKPGDDIIAQGSGGGLINFAVQSEDSAVAVGPAFTLDCQPHPMVLGVPIPYPFDKSGGFEADDPNASFYEAYFASPDLRLPAGKWTITASGRWYVGGCGGRQYELSASVTVVVEP